MLGLFDLLHVNTEVIAKNENVLHGLTAVIVPRSLEKVFGQFTRRINIFPRYLIVITGYVQIHLKIDIFFEFTVESRSICDVAVN